jgi:type II secretory pathway pseudopilin PulG
MFLHHRRGIAIVEIVISIAIFGIIFIIFSGSLLSIQSRKYADNAASATRIAEAELEKIRSLSFDSLTPRANSDFIGLTFNMGDWRLASDASAPSSPKVISLLSVASSTMGDVTGLIQPPVNELTDFTFQTKININPISPTDWQAGLLFRGQDNLNYYRFIFSSSVLKFEEVASSTVSTLFSRAQTSLTDTFYQIKVVASSTAFDLYFNDVLIQTVNDDTFSSGSLGILSLNNAKIKFDDVTVASNTWNFDSETRFPSGWKRFGIYDLNEGRGYLTIENYGGNEDIKKITARVEWRDARGLRDAELETFISN